MKLPLFQVDAFADRVFAGSPAAVVLWPEAASDSWPADDLLRAIAAENNLPETAFVRLVDQGNGAALPLRWFTPEVEVDLCGHATLAAAHVLFSQGLVEGDRVVFTTASGQLTVRRTGNRLQMDFPARPAVPIPTPPALLTAWGALPIREVLQARDTLVVVDREADVRAYVPAFEALRQIDTFGVILSAPGETADFVSRFFAPRQGIPEDPVTGSAHCTLAPYWANRLGRTSLTALQVSARGGRLQCDVDEDRVRLTGSVADYLHGEVTLPAL